MEASSLRNKLAKKLKARGKGDECRGVVLDQCSDSHISDLQVMVLARFSLPEKLKIGTLCTADLQKFARVLLGRRTRARGAPQRGATFHHQLPFPILYLHVYSDNLIVKLVFS